MISRRTTRIISELYEFIFSKYHRSSSGGYHTLDTDRIYDFLFDNEYDGWFCNYAKSMYESYRTRNFKEFLMKLHTGESLISITPDWSWEQRQRLGQRYLRDLAEDILKLKAGPSLFLERQEMKDKIDLLIRNLQLDGYIFQDGRLLAPESDVFDVQEETGVLQALYGNFKLRNQEIVFHHLRLSEEHYIAKRWDDSISNSRKFLESVLSEVAHEVSIMKETPLSEASLDRPATVRDYLEREGMLEKKEKEAIASVYGLLSETGGHPYMAQSEQSRLLRHLSLTFSQFVLLRLKGMKERGA